MDYSTLQHAQLEHHAQLEQHAKVLEVLGNSQEEGKSPTKTLAEHYASGDPYVVKHLRQLAHACRLTFKVYKQQQLTLQPTSISQRHFLQPLYQLALKIKKGWHLGHCIAHKVGIVAIKAH